MSEFQKLSETAIRFLEQHAEDILEQTYGDARDRTQQEILADSYSIALGTLITDYCTQPQFAMKQARAFIRELPADKDRHIDSFLARRILYKTRAVLVGLIQEDDAAKKSAGSDMRQIDLSAARDGTPSGNAMDEAIRRSARPDGDITDGEIAQSAMGDGANMRDSTSDKAKTNKKESYERNESPTSAFELSIRYLIGNLLRSATGNATLKWSHFQEGAPPMPRLDKASEHEGVGPDAFCEIILDIHELSKQLRTPNQLR
jgi:hypothetical protein